MPAQRVLSITGPGAMAQSQCNRMNGLMQSRTSQSPILIHASHRSPWMLLLAVYNVPVVHYAVCQELAREMLQPARHAAILHACLESGAFAEVVIRAASFDMIDVA